MIRRLPLVCFLMIALVWSWTKGYSCALKGDDPLPERENPCFFVSLNQVYEHQIVEIQHSNVCYEYVDPYGKEPLFKLSFFDWQHTLLASVNLPKKFGRNEFAIDLRQLGIPFSNQLITLETAVENGKKLKSTYRLIPPADTPDPVVNIVVNPVLVNCGRPEGNVIEYYGSITGGKASYTVEWTVTNAAQSALLYQPSMSTIPKPGTTPVIRIDESPGYMVNLLVTDGCGKKGEQTISVRCEKNAEKPNVLLFQPVTTLPAPSKP